jgi:hypothetical protein
MSAEGENSKSRLEQILGQTIGEVLKVIQRVPLFLLAGGLLLILLTFFVRFSYASFLREMGTLEFNFALSGGILLMISGALFEITVVFMLSKRA